jgi:hypothetical protein
MLSKEEKNIGKLCTYKSIFKTSLKTKQSMNGLNNFTGQKDKVSKQYAFI